jgi:hypothetical protein
VVALRKKCPRVFVPFSRWRSRYLACFSALVKAMDAVPGALQSVTGNLSVDRKQAQGVGVRAGGHFPRERQILTAAHTRRRTSGAEHRLQARFRISLVNHANCSESDIIRYGIIGLVVGWVMSGCIGRQACGERAVPAAMR